MNLHPRRSGHCFGQESEHSFLLCLRWVHLRPKKGLAPSHVKKWGTVGTYFFLKESHPKANQLQRACPIFEENREIRTIDYGSYLATYLSI